jgi:hypothetical protein
MLWLFVVVIVILVMHSFVHMVGTQFMANSEIESHEVNVPYSMVLELKYYLVQAAFLFMRYTHTQGTHTYLQTQQ